MQTIDSLNTTLRSYLDAEQSNHVKRAYYFAEQAHFGQLRRSGEPYVTHPLAVAGILADMHMDHQSLMAAMLHDVIEDTGIEKSAIGTQFGSAVAELVDGVSKLTQMEFESLEDGRTLVTISEEGWRQTEGGLRASYSNCEGWMQVLCSLKAYLEHGIILRDGMYI